MANFSLGSCKELSGRDADVNVVSNSQMQLAMSAAGRVDLTATEFGPDCLVDLTGFFDWSVDVAERLRFVEVTRSPLESRR